MEQNSQPRPKDRTKKIALFEQKEKTHTIQNQITINLDGIIICKSAHSTGSHHDYKIYKAKHPYRLRSCYNFMILSLGIQRLSRPNQHYTIQEKKDRELSASSQKEWNESQSKTRIKVEHALLKSRNLELVVVMCLGTNYADMME